MSRVYVGRLPFRADERDLEHFFRGYGRIRDVIIKTGFGFVEFESSRDADDACRDLDGREMMGHRVIVELTRRPEYRGGYGGGGGGGGGYGGGGRFGGGRESFRGGAPERTNYRMEIENLSTRFSWQDMKDAFREQGCDGMCFADAHNNRRNEGVIYFESHKDLKRALDKMDGRELNGRAIKCVDRTRESVSRSRSRSRSPRSRSPRSRSRSRSKSKSKSRSATPASKHSSRAASKASSRASSRSRSPSK